MKTHQALLVCVSAIAATQSQSVGANATLGKPVSHVSGPAPSGSSLSTLTDGIFMSSGGWWQSGTVWWESQDTTFEIQLGDYYDLSAAIVQADCCGNYVLQALDAYSGQWVTLWTVPTETCGGVGGVQTRPNCASNVTQHTFASAVTSDRIRVSGILTSIGLALSEVQVFGDPVDLKTWDGGAGTTSWHDAANWNPDGVPGADDDVLIDLPVATTVYHSTGSTPIRSLVCKENFSLTFSTINIYGTSEIDGTLYLDGGVLDGAGDLTIDGDITWQSGGFDGQGIVIFGPNCTASSIACSANRFLGRDLQNFGAIELWCGRINLYYDSTITNFGYFGGACNVECEVGTQNRFVNEGLVESTSSFIRFRSDFQCQFEFVNNGVVRASLGAITLDWGGSGTGRLEVVGNGTYIGIGQPMTQAEVVMTAGRIEVNSALTITDSASWTGGYFGNGGTTTIAAGATLNLGSGGVRTFQGTLINNGTTTIGPDCALSITSTYEQGATGSLLLI